jgi:hypothetical protein
MILIFNYYFEFFCAMFDDSEIIEARIKIEIELAVKIDNYIIKFLILYFSF